ncbi:thiamine biosynthesis protein [Aliarcobacter faecis]|uniref:sulfur carrier protein ThiS n=1 Tax=Aliarcobacter faecis TaxID=1564138 RepID=UPI00047B2F21|nr:sulfur carrier protein ThiS [Aliarcobacter faecis]QKF74145.1 thiamine biosynthesis protein [Aliarcobacter faecis]
MKIIVNGKNLEFKDNLTLLEIIKELKIEDKVMAAAVNMDIIKKDIWSSYKPKENDILELLNFVGGG